MRLRCELLLNLRVAHHLLRHLHHRRVVEHRAEVHAAGAAAAHQAREGVLQQQI